MTEEERKRYFGILVEDLYHSLQLLQESTIPDKKEKAAKMIHEFYKDYKEGYEIKDIKEVIKGLDKVNENMKKSGKKTDIQNMYYEEEPGDR